MSIITRVLLWAGVLAVLAVLGGLYVRASSDKAVAQAAVQTVVKATEKAQVQRKAAVLQDALQGKRQATAQAAVRSVIESARKQNEAIKTECPPESDAIRISVLNEAVRSTNRIISSGQLPE